jgi:hypothetical protein
MIPAADKRLPIVQRAGLFEQRTHAGAFDKSEAVALQRVCQCQPGIGQIAGRRR